MKSSAPRWGVAATATLFAVAIAVGYHLGGTPPAPIELGRRGGPDVRVAHRTDGPLELSLRGPWALEHRAPRADGFTMWRRATGDARWTIRADGDRVAIDGPVRAALAGVVRVRAASIRDGNRPVWGMLDVGVERGALRAVATLDLETYLLGVVGSEMGAAFPIESLKAQAVAARSYALARAAPDQHRPLAPTVADQVFRPADRIPASILRAVDETRGEILGSRSDPVKAYFHSTCGGATRDAAPDFDPSSPIRGTRCHWCRHSRLYSWVRSYALRDVTHALEGAGVRLDGLVRAIRVVETDASGRVRVVAIDDRRRTTKLSGDRFRSAMNRAVGRDRSRRLLSTRLTVQPTPDRTGLAIKGHGWGHGVGMCQIGAAGLARTGADYRRILATYYPALPLTIAWGDAVPTP